MSACDIFTQALEEGPFFWGSKTFKQTGDAESGKNGVRDYMSKGYPSELAFFSKGTRGQNPEPRDI